MEAVPRRVSLPPLSRTEFEHMRPGAAACDCPTTVLLCDTWDATKSLSAFLFVLEEGPEVPVGDCRPCPYLMVASTHGMVMHRRGRGLFSAGVTNVL